MPGEHYKCFKFTNVTFEFICIYNALRERKL